MTVKTNSTTESFPRAARDDVLRTPNVLAGPFKPARRSGGWLLLLAVLLLIGSTLT